MNAPLNPTAERREAERDLPGFLITAVRREHPEWVSEDGHCPPCEAYQQKLAHLFAWTHQIRVAA